MLFALAGLPGVGKTTLARALAREVAAVHVRVDSIEQALRRAGWKVEGEGYEVAYAVAEDNLRVGRVVVADCVNPWSLTRAAWRAVAERAGSSVLEVEVVCSDQAEHQRRVQARVADIPALALPSWSMILERDYHAWTGAHLVVDTARLGVEEAVKTILSASTRPRDSAR